MSAKAETARAKAAMLTPEEREELALKRQATLRSALREAEATKATGHDTSVALAKQGESIARISQKLDATDQSLDTSDRHVKSIGSFFSMLWQGITGEPKAKPAQAGEKAAAAAAQGTVAAASSRSECNQPPLRASAQKQQQQQQSQQQQKSAEEQHDEVENELLDQLHSSVLAIGQTAKQHNSVIKAQNEALAETALKMDKVQNHMQSTTKKIQRLM